MGRFALAVVAALIPAAGSAQHVAACDAAADVRDLVEPWEDHTRAFANGAVRVALIDTVVPVNGPLRLLVLTPPYTAGDGERHCAVVGWTPSQGFATLDFAGLTPTYDPVTGLGLELKARFFDQERAFSNVGILDVVIDQGTGEVRADFTVTGRD